MTTSQASSTDQCAEPVVRARLRRAGTVTFLAGVVGAAAAVVVLATTPMVPAERYSYPFDSTWFAVSQVLFAAQHLAMVAGVLGLATLPRPTRTRRCRTGLVLAGAGLLLLGVWELVGLVATRALVDSAVVGTLGAGYGVWTLMVGTGFVLVGWVALRERLLHRGSWLPLAFGAWVFVVLLPALGGSDVAGRLAIGGWLALYAVLGVALRGQGRR